MSTEVVTKNLGYVDIPTLKQFASSNQETIDTVIADKVVEEFLNHYKSWKDVVGFIVSGEDGEQLYGDALCKYSNNLHLSNHLSSDKVNLLQEELLDFEGKVKYKYGLKNLLYYNLVKCLHKLSLASREELKDYLKKAIYYSLAEANHTSYKVECYAYRSASKYIINSFKKEKLSMSSPTTFNDPFDCPILELLTLYGDDISKLASEAYRECLKITCFVKNTKVQPEFDERNDPIWIQKHDDDPEEYLNELMWAHYADNHKGVCIKYHFNNDFTKFADETKSQIAYFRDIKYTSDMDVFRKNGAINLQDAFFVKGEAWEYENELRLLAYNLEEKGQKPTNWLRRILRLLACNKKGPGDYASIDAKDNIAAIYFGLKCPTDKQCKIIDILKGRKWVNEKSVWDEIKCTVVNTKEEYPVEFFQMVIDDERFGKLKAVKIEII